MPKIDTGKYYKTRDGHKAYIAYYEAVFERYYGYYYAGGWHRLIWRLDGKLFEDSESPADIVKNWRESPKAKRRSPRYIGMGTT